MKTLYFDIDSQLDFLYPSGALYVPGAERVLTAIAGLNRQAASEGSIVVSTVDAHTEDDPEFRVWPHHCVAGTWGQRKAESTLLDGRVLIPNRPGDLAIEGARQIIVEKQTVDVFAAPNLARVIERLQADRYIVYGVVTEICVLYAVRGLVKSGKPVQVMLNAIRSLTDEASAKALAEMRALGAQIS